MYRQVYSEKEFSSIVNLSYSYIKKLRQAGLIRYCRFGRRIGYTVEHVQEFIKSREQSS